MKHGVAELGTSVLVSYDVYCGSPRFPWPPLLAPQVEPYQAVCMQQATQLSR